MTADFSAVALLGIINFRDNNGTTADPVLDDSAINYLAGALVYLELARIGCIKPNLTFEDSFRLVKEKEAPDPVTREFISRLPDISSLSEDGAELGSHALELYSEAIEGGQRSREGRLELVQRFGATVSGKTDTPYADNALATLLGTGEVGLMVAGLLGDTKDIKEHPLTASHWSGQASPQELDVMATVISTVSNQLNNLS
jgi:hypothetical protein